MGNFDEAVRAMFMITEQVHLAGPLDRDGVQTCTRCGYVLTDYRGAMAPDGTPPLQGWPEGAHVEVIEGNPKYEGLTDAPPDCISTTGRIYADSVVNRFCVHGRSTTANPCPMCNPLQRR